MGMCPNQLKFTPNVIRNYPGLMINDVSKLLSNILYGRYLYYIFSPDLLSHKCFFFMCIKVLLMDKTVITSKSSMTKDTERCINERKKNKLLKMF